MIILVKTIPLCIGICMTAIPKTIHTTTLINIKTSRVQIYVDDILITDPAGVQLFDNMIQIPAPTSGGLFVGGIPDVMEESIKSWKMAKSLQGFNGTIKDVAFIDDM